MPLNSPRVQFFVGLTGLLALAVVMLPPQRPSFADDKKNTEKKKMSVQVRKSAVRVKPSGLGKVVGTLMYGDRVEVLESSGKSWNKVKKAKPPLTGWLRATALSPKKIVLEATGTALTTVSGEEVAMAGKGFDDEVEMQYRATNRELEVAFAVLDRVERDDLRANVDALVAFLNQGRLKPKEMQ